MVIPLILGITTKSFDGDSFAGQSGFDAYANYPCFDLVQVLIGNREWMLQNSLRIEPDVDQVMIEHEERGHTAVLAAINGVLVGMLAVADTIKDEAPLAIRTLQNMGLKVILLTGDNRKTANAIASQVMVGEFFYKSWAYGSVSHIRNVNLKAQ